ncbi:ABC transporter ATP-binding protein [Streptomyces albiaxialis]|uniref:ABC transporter ATP-binding protein n=1 Tax=Streptomyces albiaxialis TaxID=329523 RepID=A0ABN2VNE0_9ACTN
MTARPLIEARGLTARTADGTVLVDGVGLALLPGRVTALVGPSGSGKTTTALALLGEAGEGVRLSGRVRVDGTEVVGADGATTGAHRVRGGTVAYLPQAPGSALNPARRTGSVLAELAALHALSADGRSGQPGQSGPSGPPARSWRRRRAAARERAREALLQAQLPGDRATLRRFPHQFSGGQQQRVALAQALACGPRALVLDEPGTGLDTVTKAALTRELARLAGTGLALLLLSHDHAMVRALADEAVLLEGGRVTARGTPDAVLPPLPTPRRPARPDPAEGESPSRTPLFEARGLTAWLRRRGHDDVLHDVSLHLRPGECLGVAGRSGSGKTTLARCLAGLHERRHGDVLLDGEPLPVLRRRDATGKRRVQYVWQEVHGSFDPRRPVLDQVARTAVRLRGLAPGPARERAAALLGELGVQETTAGRLPDGLSGGELQRAAFARAALAGPDVLVCDEITSALDAEVAERILARVERMRREQGTAVLWIGHDLRLLRRAADRILVLDEGRVVETGECAEVLARPDAEATRRLLEAERPGGEPLRAPRDDRPTTGTARRGTT